MVASKTSAVNDAVVLKPLPASTQAEMDRALSVLTTHKDAWAMLAIQDRIALLDQVKGDLPGIEKRWVLANMAARDAKMETLAEGDEWSFFSIVYKQIWALRQSLQDIARSGTPRIPGKISTRPNGQVVVQVHPGDWKEKIALGGMRAEVWMDPSVSLQAGGIPQASFYQNAEKKGGVCLVMGAGNAGAWVAIDFLTKLFVEGQVVALKMNPVNAYVGPIIEDGFKALINAGFMQVLYGGAQEGGYLCNHPAVDDVHMTGSDRTFNAIVFGPGEEGKQRKQARQPLFTKHFTAELGNISPVIIVPGPWMEKDIRNQSARIASWLVLNSGCTCSTPRMIIQMKGWEHRDPLNQGISDFLASTQTRKAFYPGSFELHQQFIQAHPGALKLGEAEDGTLPWTFIPKVDPAHTDDICFTREPFMSLFSETALEAGSVVEFIRKAVEFANDRLWGTLCASIVVHPASLKDPAVAAALDQAIADLRYGSIVVNQSGGMASYLPFTPWGGYPGSPNDDMQSGIGVVKNPLMFDHPQKSVCYAEFTPFADPQLANFSNSHLFSRQDVRYQANPTIGNLVKLLWRAMTLK
jgi:hypothetical protein